MQLKFCKQCETDISERHPRSEYCKPCAKVRQVAQWKEASKRYSRRGKRIDRNKLPEVDRICLVCSRKVRHNLKDARICLPCRMETLEDMSDLAEGMPADTGTRWSEEEPLPK